MRLVYCWSVVAGLAIFTAVSGQELGPSALRPFDGIQAGLDAFRLGEEQRQSRAVGQVALNEQLWLWPRWPAPWGPSLVPVFSAAGGLARQSIGQRQVQMGPRRWESHSVYAPPPFPYMPLPPVASPWLDRTPYAAPRAEPAAAAAAPPAREERDVRPRLPPPAPRRGPREY